MKKYITILIFCAATIAARAQQESIAYHHAATSIVSFYNARQGDSLYSLWSPEMQAAVPADKTMQLVTQLNTQLGAINTNEFIKMDGGHAVYKTTFANATLSMLLSCNDAGLVDGWRLVPYQAPKADTTASNLVLKTPTGNIYGTLTVPQTNKKVPVVLIIAGSGPTDRDCNSGLGLTSNAYLMLADSLMRRGIACARYDKRGVGESQGALRSEAGFTFNDLVTDAVGMIQLLKADSRFSEVIVLGHSEGSLVGMLAAQKENVAKYISVAGAGEPIDKILEKQLAVSSSGAEAKARIIMDSLKQGHKVVSVPDDLQTFFHASVQPFMMSWLQYDPRQEIRKIKIPILIVQGTTDIQVSPADAEALHKANPAAKLAIIPGMSHLMKPAPADRQLNEKTYNDPNLPLSPDFVRSVSNFILR